MLASTLVLLAACINAPVTATPTGTGAVIIAWASTAGGINDKRGDVLVLCRAEETVCGPSTPAGILYIYVPAYESTSATLTPAVTVTDAAGHHAILPVGNYALPAHSDTDGALGFQPGPIGDLLHIELGGGAPRDGTIWWQSVAGSQPRRHAHRDGSRVGRNGQVEVWGATSATS